MSRGAIRVQGREEPDRVICDAGPLASARCEVQRLVRASQPLPEGWLEATDPFGRLSRFSGEVIKLHLCRACQVSIPGREGVDTRSVEWEFVRFPTDQENALPGPLPTPDRPLLDAALWRRADGEQRWMVPEQERELGLVRPGGVGS